MISAPHEKGVALVISLILMSAMVAIGVSGAGLALHSERQSSNAVQQAIAFRAAEAGAHEVIAALRQLSADGVLLPTTGEWASTDVHQLGGIFAASGGSSAAMVDHDATSGYWVERILFFDDRIAIQTRGALYDGLGIRGVNVILNRSASGAVAPGGIPSRGPGSNAIVACEGVSLQGSGAIRAMNSQDAAYSGSDADVFAIGSNASIDISGGTRIEGSVSATGSSVIEGGAVANGDVTLTGGGSSILGDVQTPGSLIVPSGSANTHVGGNAVIGGNISLTNGQVRGNAYAGGNLTLSNSSARVHGAAAVNGDVNLFGSGGGIVDGALTYGGDIVGMQGWQSLDNYAIGGSQNSHPGVTRPPDVDSQDCDPFDIAEINDAIRDAPTMDVLQGNYTPTGKWNGARHDMGALMPNSSGANKSLDIQGNWLVSSQAVDFPAGGRVMVKVDGDFSLSGGGNLAIPPNTDVVMVVDGNFSINGGTALNIGSGSTLTVHLGGTMNVSGGGFIVQDGNPLIANQSGELSARVNVFSDHNSTSNSSPSDHNASGIRIGGNSSYYANIYAPNTDVSIMEGGTLNGAVWGQRVKVPGGAKINYDVALREAFNPLQTAPIEPEDASGPVVLTLQGWQRL